VLSDCTQQKHETHQTPTNKGLPFLQIMHISGKQELNLHQTFTEKKGKKIIPSSVQPSSNPSAFAWLTTRHSEKFQQSSKLTRFLFNISLQLSVFCFISKTISLSRSNEHPTKDLFSSPKFNLLIFFPLSVCLTSLPPMPIYSLLTQFCYCSPSPKASSRRFTISLHRPCATIARPPHQVDSISSHHGQPPFL